MFNPLLPELLRMCPHYNMIPVSYSFLADVETPISVYQKLRGDNSFLLESIEGGGKWARYSFIGMDPFLCISGFGEQLEICDRSGKRIVQTGNPLQELRSILARYRSPQLDHLPRFSGGAVGYFAFDAVRYHEPHLLPHKNNDLNMADLRFLLTDTVIAFDHLRQEIHVIVHLHVDEGDSQAIIAKKYHQITQKIGELIKQIKSLPTNDMAFPVSLPRVFTELPISSNVDRDTFAQMVKQAKEYIAAGDVFQVVLSQRFEVDTMSNPFAVYRMLRIMNPSPYMYYLQFADETLVGASPEMLVRVERGKVEVRPIAGTRRRGATPQEDRELGEDLLRDEKERAEHLMLVDLGRNDVGRVAKHGSVQVDQFMALENYSHVMHMVSHVSGELRDDLHSFDAFLSCFPAGTVSGAPKVRALEIISGLENISRNAYAGAIGYLGFDGNLDSCITIRTVFYKHNRVFVQAGAGIVADSIPENEYEETRNKALGMIRAIQAANQVFGTEGEGKYVSNGAS